MKTNKNIISNIPKDSIVKLPSGNVGVLVDDKILAAAQSVAYPSTVPWPLGHPTVRIETSQGSIKLGLMALEPVTDFAVLGGLDFSDNEQEEADKYNEWRVTTKPFVLAKPSKSRRSEKQTVFIRDRAGRWIEDTVKTVSFTVALSLGTEKFAHEDVLGGPVLNEHGELLGFISINHQQEGEFCLFCSNLSVALPSWALTRLEKNR